MGLDISAYQNLKFIGGKDIFEGEECEAYDKGYILLYINDGCDDRSDGLVEGWYQPDETDAAYSFRAGSYSGYNDWRNWLSLTMLGKQDEEVWSNPDYSQPFVHLIHFSDCEGFIGPQTSQKLYEAFVAHRDKAEEHAKTTNEPEWFMEKYDDWQEAFRIASQNGVVKFH